MTVYDRAIKYLERCKHPKTLREISDGGHINHNSLRRVIGGVKWKAPGRLGSMATKSKDGKLVRMEDGGVYRYSVV